MSEYDLPSSDSVSSQPGLWSGSGGFLRPSVTVRQQADTLSIAHSIWELEIPTRFLETEPQIRDFLERRKSIRQLGLKTDGANHLIQLLIGQGCITYDGLKDAYRMDELEYVLRALIFQWYGIYYSHPFWKRLSTCRASIQELFGWALRTYHLSRSAGVTAARGAVYAPTPQVRHTFLASAIEEYSHCDCFFFPRHPVFGLEDSWIEQLIPLASSTAFDNQMSVIAEDDWLAHTCVAYFQEYTVAFRDNAIALYDRLEQAYGLHGFFDGWKRHIGYDLQQSHADEFGDLIKGERETSRKDALRSFQAAATTVEYLMGALDELMVVNRDATLREFRVPPALLAHGDSGSSVLGGIVGLRYLMQEPTCLALCDKLLAVTTRNVKPQKVRDIFRNALRGRRLADLILRALSRSTCHRHIVLLGKILKETTATQSSACVENDCHSTAVDIAIFNFLRESSVASGDFTFLLLVVCRFGSGDDPGRATVFDQVLELLEEYAKGAPLALEDRARLSVRALQLVEIAENSTLLWQSLPAQDVVLDGPPTAQSI